MKNAVRVISILFLAGFLVVCFAIVSQSIRNVGGGSPAYQSTYQVKYVVKGTITADLTYENGEGGTEQVSGADVDDWSKTFTMHKGDFYYISAQNEGTEFITCEVWVDGSKVKTSTSHGQFTIATCSGSVGR